MVLTVGKKSEKPAKPMFELSFNWAMCKDSGNRKPMPSQQGELNP